MAVAACAALRSALPQSSQPATRSSALVMTTATGQRSVTGKKTVPPQHQGEPRQVNQLADGCRQENQCDENSEETLHTPSLQTGP